MNEKMLAKFTDICFNRLQTIENFIMQIEAGTEDKEDVIVLMRELHTLKGESRIMSLIEMSDVVHVIEDAMLWRNESEYEAPDAFFNLLYAGLDVISGMCADGLTEIDESHLEKAKNYIQTLTTWLTNPTNEIALQDRKNNQSANVQAQENTTHQDLNSAKITEQQSLATEQSVEIACIHRLLEILAQAQQAPLSDEELNSVHPLLHALTGHAQSEEIINLSEAMHFVIAWGHTQVFMIDDDAFFIMQDGLGFLEALVLKQVPDAKEAVEGFLEQLGEWVDKNIQEPPTIPKPESIHVPESVLRILHVLEEVPPIESTTVAENIPVETSMSLSKTDTNIEKTHTTQQNIPSIHEENIQKSSKEPSLGTNQKTKKKTQNQTPEKKEKK